MDLLTLLRAVLRRWYVSVPIALAGVGAALYLQSTVPPQYEASGSVLLEVPEFDPSSLPISLVDLGTLATEVQDELAGETGGNELLVQARDRSTVDVIVVADTEQQAESVARDAIERLAAEVTGVQERAGVEEADQVRLSTTDSVQVEELEDGRSEAIVSVPLLDPAAEVPNPYGAGGTTAQLLEVALTSDAGRARIAERTGPGVGFGLSTSTRDGSIIGITTMGSDPQVVLDAFEPVREVMEEELQARQDRAQVPRSRHISVEVLAAPGMVRDVSPPLDRSVAATVALGGLLAVALAVIADSLLIRRQRRQPAKQPPADWWPAALAEVQDDGPETASRSRPTEERPSDSDAPASADTR